MYKEVDNNDPDAVAAAKAAADTQMDTNGSGGIVFEKIVKGERVIFNGGFRYLITFVALSGSDYPSFYECEILIKIINFIFKIRDIKCAKITKERLWRILGVQ